MTAKAKKWTKADINRLTDHIKELYLLHRPFGQPETWKSWINGERCFQIVVSSLKNQIRLFDHRKTENTSTALHFAAHPHVYGDSTPEMVERFQGYADEAAKDSRKAQALLARVENEGLPLEVLAYDPTR